MSALLLVNRRVSQPHLDATAEGVGDRFERGDDDVAGGHTMAAVDAHVRGEAVGRESLHGHLRVVEHQLAVDVEIDGSGLKFAKRSYLPAEI